MMSVEKMIDLYLAYGLDPTTWRMLWNMTSHGLISSKNWRKFYDTCHSWTVSEDGTHIYDALTGKILFRYDEDGDLVKA